MRDKSLIEEMKSYYNQRANYHDEYMNYKGIEKMEELYLPIINNISPVITNQIILEIACGTGNWTQVIAKRAKSVKAIDSSHQSLAIAEKKLSGLKNVTFILRDAYTLERLTHDCNVIFAVDFFSHIPNKQIDSFLASIQNSLPSGTPVLFLEMEEKEIFKDEIYYIDNKGNRVIRRVLPNGNSFEVVKNFQTEAELIDIFSKYGDQITFTKFESLQRWMLYYRTK